MLLRSLVIALGMLTAFSSSATRYYVKVGSTGAGTGLSWTNAFTDLQEALSVVITGDEIWVAAGQYRPTTSTDRTVSFVLRDGVDLIGGFAGTETSVDERDIASNPTTLNGDIGQLGEVLDNSFTILRGSNITTTLLIDGFRIINANNTSSQNGGGFRITSSLGGQLILRNCTFFSNRSTSYGGGIYVASSNLTIENCEFLNNQSGNGGAIHNGNNNGGDSNLVLRDCLFKGNTANSGACLDNTARYQSLIIDRCFFTNNLSANNVIVIDDFLSAKLMNSAIIGNSVNGFSSEVLRVNSFGSSTSPFDMINCTIAHNRNTSASTIQGAMVQLEDNHMRVSNCIIYGNTSYAGGQMRNGPIVSNSLVEGGYAAGTQILNSDPQFVDPNASAASNFDATGFDYTLLASSPAINVGNNAAVDPTALFDLALNSRVQGLAVDLGCYESSITTSLTTRENPAPICYYDAVQGDLVFRTAESSAAGQYRVFGGNGQLVAQGRRTGDRIQLGLGSGIHLFVEIGGEVLRFWVP